MSQWIQEAYVRPVQVDVHDATSPLSTLVEAVLTGEDVVIAHGGVPVARLVRYEEPDDRPAKHPFGLHAGQIWIADDIWDPDPELEAALDKRFGPWEPETP